jgi:opacity protein-like surface antigen
MQIRKLNSLIGLSAVLLLVPLTAAQAKGPGIYLGGAWGAYSIKKSNLDDNDDVLKAYVGVQFNDWFSIEGSWTDFNRLNNDSGDKFEADGKGLAAVISFPVGSTSTVFAKGGQFWWDSDSAFGGTLGASKGNDPFWGAGFRFGFNDHLALRLEVERYDVADTKLKTFTAGVEFKF